MMSVQAYTWIAYLGQRRVGKALSTLAAPLSFDFGNNFALIIISSICLRGGSSRFLWRSLSAGV